jgi:glutamyl-Q tRNA(Asp) synthetase
MSAQQVIGRFAPSPTGPLHFGSLIAAVGSYCLARQVGGRWLLRMEDLDTPRVVPGAADEILFTLDKLGLHWDGEIVWQSRRVEAYRAAVEMLRDKGLVFDCACSRKDILLSAPHPGEEGPVYPGTCRPGLPAGRKPRALRIIVPERQICFTDGVFGPMQQVLTEAVGDFVLRRADGMYAYQLAVVVDDTASRVNQVVRGADLLLSTPRQIFLHACLGSPVPEYVHLPLLTDKYGEKISKRHGAVSFDPEVNPSALIVRALSLLGQIVPEEIGKSTSAEILEWACRNIDRTRIPVSPQGLVLDDLSV